MDVPAPPPAPTRAILDPAVRDEAACDPLRDDMEIFDIGNSLYDQAVAAVGSDQLSARALGLETALFSAVPWSQFGSSFISPEVQDLLAERMSSPSARVRMTVGLYLWRHGTPARRRYGAAAAGAALQWGRELLAAPPDDHQRRFYDAMRALDVAAELGSASGQKAVVAEVCEVVVKLLARAAMDGDATVPSLASDVITRLRTHFTPEQRRQIIASLEDLHSAAVADITPMSPPHLAGCLLELRRDLAHANGDADEAHQCDREYAALLAEHATDRGEALVEAAFLGGGFTPRWCGSSTSWSRFPPPLGGGGGAAGVCGSRARHWVDSHRKWLFTQAILGRRGRRQLPRPHRRRRLGGGRHTRRPGGEEGQR
jgi:hypothetical protein